MSATSRPAYNAPTRALTSRQERKLVDYLDERFLDLTRNFKKRSDDSSTLKSLPDYLEAARKLLAFILQIPPIDPSTSLRIAYLLHLTGDALGSITGYKLGHTDDEVTSSLRDLADFLDDLDQAWVAVLKSQVWDPTTGEGVDFVLPTTNGEAKNPLRQSPPSQTDLARLQSLLYSGEASLEEWMTSERGHTAEGDEDGDGAKPNEAEEDISEMLDRMGVRDDFDALFARTLNLLGGFGEEIAKGIVNPGVESTME